MDDKDYTRLLNYAFRLLSRRDYSEHEIQKKLAMKAKMLKWKESPTEKVLGRLKELRYLDDEKFARQFIANRLEFSPKGKFMLRYELKRKGIPAEVFSKIWEEAGVPDSVLADRILAQKKRSLSRICPEKRRKKIMSLLASRGISTEVIYGKISA